MLLFIFPNCPLIRLHYTVVLILLMFVPCRLNGGPFEEEKPLRASQGSHDLEDEEVEDLGADEEEGEEPSNTPVKSEGMGLSSNLSDDVIQDEMDYSEPNDLNLSCKTSPRR